MKFNKKDATTIFGLLVIFLLIAIPGIDWGAPAVWNPDEIVQRVAFSLDQTPVFDPNDPTYPGFPMYIMIVIGKLITALGKSDYSVIIGIRLFSVFLGTSIIALSYFYTSRLTSNRWIGIIAAFFLITNREYLINSRFAHNDIYLMFFAVLSVYSLINFQETKKKFWLYGSFFLVGLAAASKYNGGGLILAPIFIYLLHINSFKLKEMIVFLRDIISGGVISFIGYLIGNPILLANPYEYFIKVFTKLNLDATYDLQPGNQIGLWGQWAILKNEMFGNLAFYLVMIALAYIFIRLLTHKMKISIWDEKKSNSILVLFTAIVAFDIPISISYNYPPRFFLFFIPLFAVIIALFIEDIFQILNKVSGRWAQLMFALLIVGIFTYSGFRSASILLSFKNDARIPASDYVQDLSSSYIVEYTLYPPRVNDSRFLRSQNFPLIFIKFPDQVLPTSQDYDFNVGEAGIEIRKPDILIIDSFTNDRFNNQYVCDLHKDDCLFFRNLFEGKTNYQLITTFDYDLPSYLPDISVSFTNPDIYIFQRMP